MKPFIFKSKVELFPQAGGWHYVRVPRSVSDPLADLADRGLIPVTATLGKTSWATSLLPMGDGSHFIALSAKVRKTEQIELGDTVSISFSLRNR